MPTPPKQPQDRKPPKSAANPDARPEGWDLLQPFSEVAVWDQTELLEIVKPLMRDAQSTAEDDSDGQTIELMDFDTRVVGQLARKLADLAVDRGAYMEFVSGPGALERAINLGVAYAGQLGESARSTSS